MEACYPWMNFDPYPVQYIFEKLSVLSFLATLNFRYLLQTYFEIQTTTGKKNSSLARLSSNIFATASGGLEDVPW